MNEKFDIEINSEENVIDSNKGNYFSRNKILIIILSIIIVLSIIIIIIVSVKKASSNNNSSNKLNYGIGQITCIYNIKNITEKTKILGYDYINDENIGIIYKNKMINSVKEFEFKNIGNEKIIFVINNNNLNLDNMFKNVTSLISVEIKSEKKFIDFFYDKCF